MDSLLQSPHVHHRFPLAVIALICLCAALAIGQRGIKDTPYADLPIRQTKDKQTALVVAPPERKPLPAVTVETSRLVFQSSPLTSRGLLSVQAREALKTLVRTNGSAEIVRLRAFVAGSGDMRRIQDVETEVFADKRLLPPLTVIQVGALPMLGAQVLIESTAEARNETNSDGLAFISAQPASSVTDSAAKVRALLESGGMHMSDILRMTCYVSSLEDAGPQPAGVPVAVNMVQMQREPVRPNAACEAVARITQPQTDPLRFVTGASGAPGMALVSARQIVISGSQLGFGAQDADVKLAFERLQKDVGSARGDLRRSILVHCYLMSRSLAEPVRKVRDEFEGAAASASTMLAFEGLPSIDAVFAVDAVTLPAAQ